MLLQLLIFLLKSFLFTCQASNSDKLEFCSHLQCDIAEKKPVCGIKPENNVHRLRVFESECELLKYGCKVNSTKAYGLISMDYCDNFFAKLNQLKENSTTEFVTQTTLSPCKQCSIKMNETKICAIRNDGQGYKVAIFSNLCLMEQHNCLNDLNYTKTDDFLCFDLINTKIPEKVKEPEIKTIKAMVVVRSDADFFFNINESVDQFFAATHFDDLPLKDYNIDKDTPLNMTRRKMPLKIIKPVVLFQPWIKVPKKVQETIEYQPTLSSCFHKCPRKCPDTYAPVCGLPGNIAREPSLMFQNHCMMDMAQCKMWWANASPTAQSSAYVESAFMFCLGDELNGLYRMLPVIKTLQKMGRIKKKGKFRYKMSNFRFLNKFLLRNPKIMG